MKSQLFLDSASNMRWEEFQLQYPAFMAEATSCPPIFTPFSYIC